MKHGQEWPGVPDSGNDAEMWFGLSTPISEYRLLERASGEFNEDGTRKRRPFRWLAYAISWLRAEGVGMTVCRVVGHRKPSDELEGFRRLLADSFGHPADSEFRRPTCDRCGGFL